MSLAASVSSLYSLQTGWIVQKFGGTSVGKFPEQICDDIIKVYNESHKVVVVCSARSTHLKTQGTTTRLLTAAELAADDKQEEFQQLLKLVQEDHVNNAKEKIKNPELRERLVKETVEEIEHVKRLLNACLIIGEISAKSNDVVMACGEKLSCRFMAYLLKDRGVRASYVDLSSVTTNMDFSNGLDAASYKTLGERFAAEVRKLPEGTVPVMTGFFGLIPGGLLRGVGRGYTDLCAALTAVGLGADELQIWKEVDGIFTADPRKVQRAKLLSSVTPDEAAELTYYGSEVIHPFTMEQVIKARIPIRIKNVMNPTGEGTIIYPDNLGKRGEATPPHPPISVQNLPSSVFTASKTATAVTAKSDIAVLNIHSNKKTLSHGFLANVFTILDKHKLVVDLISTSEVHISMALHYTSDLKHNFGKALEELTKYGDCDVTKDLCIVSLVGIHMKQLIGIAGAMFKILADERINIEMISQGANEINISCVIDKKDVIKALNALHDRLLLRAFTGGNAVDQRLENLKLDDVLGDKTDFTGPPFRSVVENMNHLDVRELLLDQIELCLEQNVLGSHVSIQKSHLGAVFWIVGYGLDDLVHWSDACSSCNHHKLSHHVRGVGEESLWPTHTDTFAQFEPVNVLGDVTLVVNLDQQVKVALAILVQGHWSVRADNLLAADIGANGNMLANRQSQNVCWSWKSKSEDSGILGHDGLLDQWELLEPVGLQNLALLGRQKIETNQGSNQSRQSCVNQTVFSHGHKV
ncbi:hypothetical protein OGAPHI_001591 [Ogataea philodendri]|uniref:aspartate kinase n=1 Tax=Ogataea philodendri TaxID=1378263 RepID=A0A9P8T8Q4_9ASCO|nr:uncharacterized protein OGAPHI_001591 [Ogataea philodendri]KAH3669470.1 hypothetical protein OGAPHI_001591 [Ogataea philodendri]